MEYKSSSQAFKVDSFVLMQLGNLIKDIRVLDILELARRSGMGEPKVRENLQYMRFCDMLTDDTITPFGLAILQLDKRKKTYIVEQLLLYKLSRGCSNGGHYYFTRLLNQILYDYAFQIDNKVNQSQIIEKALGCTTEEEYSRDNIENKRKNYLRALNQGLSDNTTGFGKMGMVVQKDGLYEITGYLPHALVTAYIIYDNWPKSRSELKMDEMLTKDYFPGKIFFMGQDVFQEQIEDLVGERILYKENEAGLNQIKLSPQLTADQILDRIVETCISI